MSRIYDPRDWYWLDEERGVIYSSRRQAAVDAFDAAYQDFLAGKNRPTRHPGDAELAEVLRPYRLVLKAEDQAGFETDQAMAEIERSPVLAAMAELVGQLAGGKEAALAEIRTRVDAKLAERRAAGADAKAEAEANIAEARETYRTQQEDLLASQREDMAAAGMPARVRS